MSLSKQHLNQNNPPVSFDPESLATRLRAELPMVEFAFLMGSAKQGIVKPGSDLDLAFYLSEKPDLRFYGKVPELMEEIVPGVRIDFGILNQAEPVYRFEALKGRLLFARDPEQYQEYFSLTCREYEMQIADYERQLHYRQEAAHAG